MLNIPRRVDYAVIALTHMALRPGRPCSAREIAATYNISLGVISNVLKTLARKALIGSERGTKGGYALVVQPESITIGRVLSLIEGPFRFAECTGHHRPEEGIGCEAWSCCPVKSTIGRLHERVERLLDQVTVAELAVGLSAPRAGAGRLLELENAHALASREGGATA